MMEQRRRDAERAAAQLQGPEDIAALLDACLVDNAREPTSTALLLGAIAEQADMDEVARGCQLSVATLRRELGGQRIPRFSTIQRVMHALGVQLSVRVIEPR